MPVVIGDLLQQVDLQLGWISGPPGARSREMRWVAVTELADPGRFLSGGELVLTTGLRQETDEEQVRFVREIADAGAVGLGFGTGLRHEHIPPATMAACLDNDLPLLEVPYRTPFLAINRFVADRVLGEHYGRFRQLLQTYDRLATAMLSGSEPGSSGLGRMLALLQAAVASPVALISPMGELLACAPDENRWPAGELDRLVGYVRQPRSSDGRTRILAVEVGGSVAAHLVSTSPAGLVEVLPYAVGLIGLELARQRAVLEGRRELLAQVLADVVAGSIGDTEAGRRLAGFDIDVHAPNAVMIGTVPSRPGAIRRAAAAPLAHDATVTAWLDGALVAVIRGGDEPAGAPQAMAAHLSEVGQPAVGVGGSYPGVAGLRWSYQEARQALQRGPGIHERSGLSMVSLLLSSQELPAADLAGQVLGPIRDYDRAHQSALEQTLVAYLECDGSVAAVCQRLVLHRNTVRYRLRQIEELTGRGADRTEDRMHWYLALLADSSGRPPRAGSPAVSRPGHRA